MHFLGLGTPELVVILILALVIFGPKNLPKLGASLGKTVKNLREGMESGGQRTSSDPDKIEDAEVVDAGNAAGAETHADSHDTSSGKNHKSSADEVIFCGTCGAKNPASAHFCSKCGTTLGE